ncbi:hypothetical protein M0805_002630 [Coniferiporia weirii]|nr:hypothetical protein M0805_002630 [Coniferiporia weirii]
MDTYPTLLSPIDNFSFSSFANSSASNPTFCGKSGSSSQQSALPQTPLQKTNSDWHGLLDSYSLGIWDSPFDHRQTQHPWQPHAFGSLSDSFDDSPSSSSSFLSSTTCSPWETCPGLAPTSTELPILDGLSSQYPASLQFDSYGESPARAFNDLSLGSSLRSPILLPFDLESDVVEPYNLVSTQSTDTNNSSNFISNALALDLSIDTNFITPPDLDPFLTFGNNLVTPPQSNSLPPYSEPALAPSPPVTAPSYTGGSVEEAFPSSSCIPSDSYLQSRVTRQKVSRIDYSEGGYEGDSDDEYREDELDDLPRLTKRRKAGSSGATFSLSSDEEFSDDAPSIAERGRKTLGPRRGKGSSAGAAAKRKQKRRHYCPRNGCQSSFTRITDMERHVSSVHRGIDTDANRCSFCRKAFSREDAVLRHENDSCPMRPKTRKRSAECWT